MQNNVCSDIFLYDAFAHTKTKKKMHILYTKNMENCEAMEIINSLICIFISTVQQNNASLKITTLIQNIISSLFFIPFTSNFHSSVRNDLLYGFL